MEIEYNTHAYVNRIVPMALGESYKVPTQSLVEERSLRDQS